MLEAHRLGASLYVPAVHPKLECALLGRAYPGVRSLIACTEDSIAELQLETALLRIAEVLGELPSRAVGPLRFIRPRNREVLQALLAMPGIERIHGFVLPKADHHTLPGYLRALGTRDFALMPTLETVAAFEPSAMRALRKMLLAPATASRCLALRIGGNDLLALLGMRRPRNVSIYQTPIGALIPQLVLCFKPHGFQLTGPVFDYLEGFDTLLAEAQQDRCMGLVGKTAIHPNQVSTIESVFQVCEREMAAAQALLGHATSAVVKFDGAMLEHAVHADWARSIVRRGRENELSTGLQPGNL